MNKGTIISLIMGAIIAGDSVAALAQDSEERKRNWQLSQLFEPGEHQLKAEHNGRVVIYNGLRTTDVERALDEEFDRVEHMMFSGTIIADTDGQPVMNPETGLVMVEQDGCD